MKFSCQTSEMLNALSIVTRALSIRTTMPILEGVLIETCKEGLRLTASDGSITIISYVNAAVEEDGRVVLPGRLFNEVIRKMPIGEITGSLSSNEAMLLKCMGSRTTIAGQNAQQYPELPVVSNIREVKLPQSLLREMIQKTSFAISIDDSRLILTGGLLEIEKGETHMVALDGYRLAMRIARVSDEGEKLSAIIPDKALSEIAKLMSEEEEKMVSLMIGDNQMMIEIENTTLYAQLIAGEYIDYHRIIPTSWQTKVVVNCEELSRCVDRASLMAREGKNNLVKFEVQGEKMIITSNSEVGDVYEEMAVTSEGEDLTIAFNVKYLIDVMRVMDTEEICLKFNSSVSPCVILPVEGDAFTYLVLPVRINA